MASNSIEGVLRLSEEECNIIGHMCLASRNLYNEVLYRLKNWNTETQGPLPSKQEQKKMIKDSMWALALPSQSAQQVVDRIDESYKAWFSLLKNKKVKNPRPPKFRKEDKMPVYYIQNAIQQEDGGPKVRLSISASLKKFMKEEYGIERRFLYLESDKLFKNINGRITRITLYPPEKGKVRIIVVYDIDYPEVLEDNGKYLAIDMGIHNPLTCLNSETGESFIIGRKLHAILQYFEKEIARVKSEWMKIQSRKGIAHPSCASKHVSSLWEDRRNQMNDYLHKVTKDVIAYCVSNDIHTLVIGDIKGVRERSLEKEKEDKENKEPGPKCNEDEKRRQHQNLHTFPYEIIYQKLEYKCARKGIRFVRQRESWSSQCSPLSPEVSKKYATPEKREKRGCFRDGEHVWNADTVGAFNILRLHLKKLNMETCLDPSKIKPPYIWKVAE